MLLLPYTKKYSTAVLGQVVLLYSADVMACIGPSAGEQAAVFMLYLVSAGLVFYAVFSRLTHSPKKGVYSNWCGACLRVFWCWRVWLQRIVTVDSSDSGTYKLNHS